MSYILINFLTEQHETAVYEAMYVPEVTYGWFHARYAFYFFNKHFQ